MKIVDIYETYTIPPHLALHQRTVAAVAKSICSYIGSNETNDIVTACLLHDMGNIIKFTLDKQIPGLELENIKHWKTVQQHFFDTYGRDEHHATIEIAKEIGVGARILSIIDAIGLPHSTDTLATHDEAKIIANYSDMRVDPSGVATLKERIEDLKMRYGVSPASDAYHHALRAMEILIFKKTDKLPDDITKESVENDIVAFESYEI